MDLSYIYILSLIKIKSKLYVYISERKDQRILKQD